MKRNALTPLLLATLALPLVATSASGFDYQYISDPNIRTWEDTRLATWNQNAPWDGTPAAGGPTASDWLDLATNTSLILSPTLAAPTGDPLLTRSIRLLTTSGASGQAGVSSYSGWNITLRVFEDLEVSGGRGLRISDNNDNSRLNLQVDGDVKIAAGGTLTLGNVSTSDAGTSVTNRLRQYNVTGSTLVSGTLANSGAQNTLNFDAAASTLGDLVVNSGGSVIGSVGGDGSTNTGARSFSLNARSLSGAGTVSASSMTQIGTREVHLNLTTVDEAATTFSGLLQDSTVATSGTNRLHLTVSGAGLQTLSGANTYTGQTRVKSGGTLLVDGSHVQSRNGVGGGSATDGLYHVETTATLGGSGGYIAGWSNANNTNLVYVASGGILAPGAAGLVLDGGSLTGSSARHLRLEAGAELVFTLAGDGSSAGHLALWNYAGAGDVVLNNNTINLSLDGEVVEGTYTVSLISFFSNAGTSAALSGLTSGLTLTGGVLDPNIASAQLIFNDTDISLQYTVVPEPATGVFGLFGLGAWVIMRRARSRR